MRILWNVFVILSFWVVGFAEANQAPTIQSFREWKAEKVQTSFQQVLGLRFKVQKAHSDGQKVLLEQLQRELSQMNWNLEVARDLSVNDYFILYLSQVPRKDRYMLAASKLQPTEMAELMRAYADSLEVQSPTLIPESPAKGSPQPTFRLPVQATDSK